VTLPQITCEELRRRLDAGEPFVLVDALPPMSFAHSHLPGAINLTAHDVDQSVTRRIPKDAEVVVYCANPDCESSIDTAQRLIELGYANVSHYAGGKDEWRRLGLPLERAGAPYQPR
jgi:rhodanese-related sulfurtransferase